ncbi:PREDICTED: putative GPI-anchored protein pfl2 [Branchiostoma belcheri]|uniref:GPI-anchored protein pfl2 n=1 Tax=Branchiostoma belcheri TaxID=7741 RepID=A0A6P4YUR5_BRABE|nr:PREDICTED: putative GPI-anchored protein pfl2 [Branchiostoma belcheri]
MASGDLTEEIEEDILSCPICYDHLTEPKALPCQHTYCCSCLQALARRAKNGQIHCPECGKMVVIPKDGVQAFPTNYLVANVLEKVQQCKENKKKQSDETDMCDIHKQEAQVVCDNCNVVVCTACLKSGHKGHVLKHIDQDKAIRMEEVKKLIMESGEVSAGLSLQESHTLLVKQRLQEKHEEIMKQIESRTAAAIHTLQRQKKNLLEELRQQRERKLKKIDKREKQCNKLIDTMLAGRTRAEEAINSTRPLLYKDVSSHCLVLSAAISEGTAYRAKYSSLQEDVCGLRFEPSLVELGRIVETSVQASPRSGPSSLASGSHKVRRLSAGTSATKDQSNNSNSGSSVKAATSGGTSGCNGSLIVLDDDDDGASNSSHTSSTDQQEPASKKRNRSPNPYVRHPGLRQRHTVPQASCSHASNPPARLESNTTTGPSNSVNSAQKVAQRQTSLVTQVREILAGNTNRSAGESTADELARRVAQEYTRLQRSQALRVPASYIKPMIKIMRLQPSDNISTSTASSSRASASASSNNTAQPEAVRAGPSSSANGDDDTIQLVRNLRRAYASTATSASTSSNNTAQPDAVRDGPSSSANGENDRGSGKKFNRASASMSISASMSTTSTSPNNTWQPAAVRAGPSFSVSVGDVRQLVRNLRRASAFTSTSVSASSNNTVWPEAARAGPSSSVSGDDDTIQLVRNLRRASASISTSTSASTSSNNTAQLEAVRAGPSSSLSANGDDDTIQLVRNLRRASASISTSTSASTNSNNTAQPEAVRAGPSSSAKDEDDRRPVKKLKLAHKEHSIVHNKGEATDDDDDDN